MKLLEERILKDGVVLPGDILKIDSFLNHQIDSELIEVIATTIKVGEPIKPAWIAVSPTTSPPTILTAYPNGCGILNPASLIISYTNCISIVSDIKDSGVEPIETAILFSIKVGNISGLNVPNATYTPGSNMDMKNAQNFNILVNVAKYALLE